ncbi:MAG: DNA-3-methyladenine glycosylase I [Phycisphaerales bacterium]|nr:DNA-3-methyladenine glycosylase I [Phycisphaerales bacterium]NNM24664.1 DNA-3-methyladenine glycosylase I [Phycisphaerales bacterium]
MSTGLATDAAGITRCAWCGADAEYQRYHDEEWGRPVADDRRLYEKICLEGFQAGLSWLTILRKRPRFRMVFAGFEPERVAAFTDRDVRRLLGDAGIVRHRGKIESTINNARKTIEVIERYGSLASFVWQFEPDPASRPKRFGVAELGQLAKTPESTALSRALRKHGFSFVGPTTMYAFMQSVGLVNDHLDGCRTRSEVESARRGFRVPASGGG